MTLNELISHYVQEEERLKRHKSESTHLANAPKDKGRKTKYQNEAAKGPTQKKQQQAIESCFFCNKSGHMKKECTKYHVWHAKKGIILNLVFFEVNLVSVPRNTWWIDSNAATHISVSIQGCLSYRKPNVGERHIFVGNGKLAEVEAIEHFRLLLGTSFYLDLRDTFIVLSFKRNLVFVSL